MYFVLHMLHIYPQAYIVLKISSILHNTCYEIGAITPRYTKEESESQGAGIIPQYYIDHK